MTRILGSGLLTVALAATPGFATAQVAVAPAQAPEVLAPVASPQNIQETRGQLRELMREVPPSVLDIIQVDPSILENDAFMAPYPRLSAFLSQFPEVRRDPAFFFGSPNRYEPSAIRSFESMAAMVSVLTGFITFVLVVGWLLGQVVSYRRWLRRSRMQTEVHTKVLDRLQSNDDLLAYIQTPAGRQFLEFGAPAAEADPAPTATAPLSRILWSVQAGVILAALGVGLWVAQRNVPEEIAGALSVLATVVGAVGIGAVVSAAAAYGLSSRFGVLPVRKPLRPSPDA